MGRSNIKYMFAPINIIIIRYLYNTYFPYSSKSKEKDNVEPVSEKKKVKEEKEDEKVEDVRFPRALKCNWRPGGELFLIPNLSMQQDFDQNKLEEEMRKRKERVEKWREEQRKKAIENIGEIKKELEEMKQGKKWSLEDDDGEK